MKGDSNNEYISEYEFSFDDEHSERWLMLESDTYTPYHDMMSVCSILDKFEMSEDDSHLVRELSHSREVTQ